MSFDVAAIRQIGRYPVENFVAEGGMAWVFRVKDPELFNAPRALKLLKPHAAQGDDYHRFFAEAQILAMIQHPNLMNVYDFGQDSETGCHFYTMDYIEGTTLSEISPDWLDETEDDDEEEDESPDATAVEAEIDPNATSLIHMQTVPVKTHHSVSDVCGYFCGVLAALARLHRENVVHRDIKPENIFLTHDGIPVLGDLGIAKGRHSPHISEVGRVPGTPLYMAPEHAMGEQTTVRSDIFSLGLSLYAVLSGETIYDQIDEVDATDGHAVLSYLRSLYEEEKEFEFFYHESIPDSVIEVIETACRIDESERYADADEFSEALRDAIEGHTWRDGGKFRPLIAAAVLFAVLGVIGFFAWRVLVEDQTQVALENAEERVARAEQERLDEVDRTKVERKAALLRESQAKQDIDALTRKLEGKADNAEALIAARRKADQATQERKDEEIRGARERRESDKRESEQRAELEKYKLAFEELQKPPPPPPPAEDLALRETMAKYETAYESRSIDDLNRIWSMSRFERAQIERLFDDCNLIRVQLTFDDSNINGITAWVDYVETIVFKECDKTRPGSKYSELTASLSLRGDEWQIKQIRER